MFKSKGRILKNFLYNFGGNLFSVLIQLINSFLIARFLIGDDLIYYATYYFSLGIIAYLSIIAGDGFNSSLVTDFRVYTQDESSKRKFLYNYWRVFNIVCLVSSSINILISIIYNFAQNKTDIAITLLILTPTLVSIALYKYANGIFQIKKIMKWDFVAKFVALTIRVIGILFIVFFEILRNPYYLASIYSFSWIIQSSVTLIPSIKLAKLSLKELFSSLNLKLVNFKKSLLFLVYFIFNGNLITLGYIFLEHFSNEVELSYFAASMQLCNILLIITGSMSVVLFSEASDLNVEVYNKRLLNTTLFTIMLILIVSIPLITLTNVFYYIYNPIFIVTTKQTAVLLFAYILNSIIQIVLIPLMHYSKTKNLIFAFAIGFLFEIAMIIPSIKYGSIGISFTILFTYLIILILILYFTSRILDVRKTINRIILVIFISSGLLVIRLSIPVNFLNSTILFLVFFFISVISLIVVMSDNEKELVKNKINSILGRKNKIIIAKDRSNDSTKLKIAMVRNSDHPINTIFVKSLRNLGMDIELLVPKGNKNYQYTWIKEFNYLGNSYYPIPIKIKKILGDYNIVISPEVFYPTMIRLYFYCIRKKKTLIVSSEKYLYSRKRLNYAILKLYYNIIAPIILNKFQNLIFTAYSYRALTFLKNNNIKNSYYLPPIIEFKNSLQSRLNVYDEKIRLITISRHIYARDIKSLIYSYRTLKAKYKDKIELTIIGDGIEFEANYQLANNLDLDIILIKKIPHDELITYLLNYDIYIQPARIEATGIAVLEALSVGLVVVSTNVGGLYDLILDDLDYYDKDLLECDLSKNKEFKNTGVVYVEDSNPESYTLGIKKIIENFTKKEIREIGIDTSKKIKKKHNQKRVYQRFIEILKIAKREVKQK